MYLCKFLIPKTGLFALMPLYFLLVEGTAYLLNCSIVDVRSSANHFNRSIKFFD